MTLSGKQKEWKARRICQQRKKINLKNRTESRPNNYHGVIVPKLDDDQPHRIGVNFLLACWKKNK